MINVVAIAAMMKADPHKASAKILWCWSQENRRRHPARPEVNTVMPNLNSKMAVVSAST